VPSPFPFIVFCRDGIHAIRTQNNLTYEYER
jgi:hypothetical protein